MTSKSARDSTPTGSLPWDSSWQESARGDERKRLLGFFEDRFGLDESLFEDILFFKKGRIYFALRSSRHLENAACFAVESAGLPALRDLKAGLKPTSVFLQVFGPKASRNVAELTEGELLEFILKKRTTPPEGLEPGYVVVRYRGYVLGCGLVTSPKDKRPALVSQLPKNLPLSGLLARG